MSMIRDRYKNSVIAALQSEFGIKNVNALPRLDKVCLNMGLGKAIDDAKMVDAAVRDMRTIAGQMPAVCIAKIAVSNFRLREGMRIACRATLRNQRMYDFLDRFINIATPRIRDFRGLKSTSFDKGGNYSVGLDEISIFPEVNADVADYVFGMDITIVIRNSTGPEMSRRMLSLLGMPFADSKNN